MEQVSHLRRTSWATRIWLFLPFLLPLLFIQNVQEFHLSLIGIVILYIYGISPMLDYIGGANKANRDSRQQNWMEKASEYVYLPRVLFLKVILIKILMLELVTSGRFGLIDSLGIAFVIGQTVSSYGIFIAHELLHRESRIDKALSEAMMVSVMYPHYCIEHLYGHHKYAATARDPATARFGETLYGFLPRSIYGQAEDAWQLESRRLARRGKSWFSVENRMLRYLIEVAAVMGLIWLVFGAFGCLAFVVQSVVAFVTLEVINYVQHYGLERHGSAPGLHDSWNSECWFSNGYWLNLGRHSDHHAAPSRSFQLLRSFQGEPELPAGFPAMFLLSFVPLLWFKVMNPRVRAVRQLRNAFHARQEDSNRQKDSAHSECDLVNYADADLLTVARPGDGSGRLMAFAVLLLFVGDLVVGPPVGLVMMIIVCAAVWSARRHTGSRKASFG